MARPKLYDKRFHFNGPAELDARVHALAERRTTAGVKTTPSDVLREALSVGLDLLEPGTRYAHATGAVGGELLALDADDVAHGDRDHREPRRLRRGGGAA